MCIHAGAKTTATSRILLTRTAPEMSSEMKLLAAAHTQERINCPLHANVPLTYSFRLVGAQRPHVPGTEEPGDNTVMIVVLNK